MTSYFKRRPSLVAAAIIAAPIAATAQLPPPDTVLAIASLDSTLLRAGATIGPRIWPGFRPDTIATLYVIPHRAKLFARWRGPLPDGFSPIPGADAAWTDTRTVSFPRGRPIAFLAVDSTSSPGSILGLAIHEQFHAFYRAAARPGRRFGAGENALLVATYPVFDVDNEAAFALEGRLLGRALRARAPADARRAAREFLTVRERRQARLDTTVVAFEMAAELNEGLAQYATLRGLRELARDDAHRFAPAADAESAREAALLDSLLVVGPRSVRRRFYATGSAIAVILDRIADSTWKERLVREDAAPQRMLAEASGYRGRDALGANRARRLDGELSQLRTEAARAASVLGSARAAQRDSILARPGLRLVVDPSRLPGGRFDWCGFDPQNVLQTAAGELLHTRMLRLCGSAGVEIQFDQPVVEHRITGVVRGAVGDPSAITLTVDGVTVSLPGEGSTAEMPAVVMKGPTFILAARRAVVARQGGELRVTPTPDP